MSSKPNKRLKNKIQLSLKQRDKENFSRWKSTSKWPDKFWPFFSVSNDQWWRKFWFLFYLFCSKEVIVTNLRFSLDWKRLISCHQMQFDEMRTTTLCCYSFCLHRWRIQTNIEKNCRKSSFVIRTIRHGLKFLWLLIAVFASKKNLSESQWFTFNDVWKYAAKDNIDFLRVFSSRPLKENENEKH